MELWAYRYHVKAESEETDRNKICFPYIVDPRYHRQPKIYVVLGVLY